MPNKDRGNDIGIEYECSNDIGLQFYSKESLMSYPEIHERSATVLFMGLKPDNEIGTHNFAFRGYVMQTAVSPDTVKIPAELLFTWRKQPGGKKCSNGDP